MAVFSIPDIVLNIIILRSGVDIMICMPEEPGCGQGEEVMTLGEIGSFPSFFSSPYFRFQISIPHLILGKRLQKFYIYPPDLRV